MLLTLLSGGACGAIINELLHRRRSRMQPIPLIERVNRLVSSDLKGFVLARTTGEGEDRRLEEIQRVREYQFTLRNSSHIHLHDAEVQFEFPSNDVEARAERPVHSKTAPVPVEAEVSDPWKKGFRWRIPEFPPGDSIEFTFRAVDPPTDEYEVALYGGGQVVIEKSKGEPTAKRSLAAGLALLAMPAGAFAFLSSLIIFLIFQFGNGDRTSDVSGAGCSLSVTSSASQVGYRQWPWQGPWEIRDRVVNTGAQRCFVQADPGLGPPWNSELVHGALAVRPHEEQVIREVYSHTRPEREPSIIAFGPDGPSNQAEVTVFKGSAP